MSGKGKYFFENVSNVHAAIRRRDEAPIAHTTLTKETQ
jgi:hypothetical protein